VTAVSRQRFGEERVPGEGDWGGAAALRVGEALGDGVPPTPLGCWPEGAC